MKRTVACIIAVITALLFLCSCGETGEETQQSETTTKTQSVTATQPVKVENKNLLTGIANLSEQAQGKRPVAVMINNIEEALPQYGISSADIMFEIVVEGGITRMMAIYGDYTKIPRVCSVRSCRYYFPIFSASFDAVYCCYGSNKSLGTATLKRLGIDYFDGQYYSALYGRDEERLKTYSREHTAYLKGSQIPSTLEKENVRTDLKKGMTGEFFNFSDKPARLSSKVCEKAVLNFSNSYYSTFTYDKASQTYLKQHSGSPHMDTGTGKQLAYTNVFIFETKVSSYDGSVLRKVDWKGGTGYYLSMGTLKEIKWSKADELSRIVITDAQGGELSVNPGKSYIGVLDKGEAEMYIETPPTTVSAGG